MTPGQFFEWLEDPSLPKYRELIQSALSTFEWLDDLDGLDEADSSRIGSAPATRSAACPHSQAGSLPNHDTLGAMDTEDWCGLVVRTPSRLRFGVVVGVFTDGPYAGRLRVHGAYRFGGSTQAEWQGTLGVRHSPRGRAAHAAGQPTIAGGGHGGTGCLPAGRAAGA
jgi:hypothetical protein